MAHKASKRQDSQKQDSQKHETHSSRQEHSKDKLVHKVESQKNESRPAQKEKLNLFKLNNYILLTIAVVAIIFLFVVLFKQYGIFGKRVAVYVNGEAITTKDLENEYKLYLKFVPSGYEKDFTKKMMLSYMIDEAILTQAAKKDGVVVDDIELEDYIDGMIKSSQVPMTKKEFIAQIESNNLSYSVIRELLYRKQFLIQKYLNITILSKIEISDADMQLYYDTYYSNSNQSFEMLKPIIKQALYTKDQYDLYRLMMQRLRDGAVIKDNIYSDLTLLTRCMSKKGIVVYGLIDDPKMKAQKQELGDAFSYLNYIDCKDASSGTLKDVCKGILVYPAWKINNEIQIGFKSADELSSLTGCKIY